MDNILAHTRVAAHAARIEKMEAAAMMSRGLAHDLNNLVTPVSTVLMHMESKVRAGSDEAAVLAHAQQSVATIQEYVRESLFFARRMEPQWQMFDAATLLPEVQEIVRDRAPQKHIAIELRSEGQTSMCADRPLLRRLLQNLVCNAIDALPVEGGTIAISAFATADNQVALRVADNGPGVPGQLVERIFEPYFTTKDFGRGGRRGLGLGLAICRKIVDLHAGTLTLTANQPHGAVFTAVLARAPDPLPVINPSNPENPGAPSVTTVLKPDAPA